jgi:cell wall-associated NlpC family hydrolase/nucleoid-associated protein YgaU
LLHGLVAASCLVAIASIALQPRASTPAPADVPGAGAAQPSPPLLALPVQPAADISADLSDQALASTAEPATRVTDKPAPPPRPSIHTVEEGETVVLLAARFGIRPETIMAANNLRHPDKLQVGQELVILPSDGVLYTLRPGESIRRVAERFGVDTMDIVNANDLGSDPDLVQPGTLLMVPGAEPVAPGRTAVVVKNVDGEQQIAAVGPGVGLPVGVTTNAAPSTRTYEVQTGDTLLSIAELFGVDVQTILSSNGISDPDTIKPGSELRILPVKGLEYTVEPSETLADIAWKYQVDLGLLLDYNDLDDPDVIHVGAKLVVPGGKLRPEAIPAPAPAAEPARPEPANAGGAVVQVAPAPRPAPAAPAAPKPAAKPAPAPPPAAPVLSLGGGGGTIVANAMKYVGYRYVFGGTSPAGFDCSGFVYYIHNHSGAPVGRGMWQQYNGGAHIPISALQPGDTVFFANTYMPGLSHDGIYIGNGQFVHASDERTGVTVSSLYTGYWQAHYVGATRLWD